VADQSTIYGHGEKSGSLASFLGEAEATAGGYEPVKPGWWGGFPAEFLPDPSWLGVVCQVGEKGG